jgi:hypothetical protein
VFRHWGLVGKTFWPIKTCRHVTVEISPFHSMTSGQNVKWPDCVNYRPALASEEGYVSKNSSIPKFPNSFNSDGENVGPPLNVDERWPQNMHTLNRR